MKRTALILLVTGAAALLSLQAVAQHYSCSAMEWPDQIASIYEHIEPACVETMEIDGVSYGRFEGIFVSETAGEVTLRFRMPEGNSIAQTFKPPENFRVRVDGKSMAFHQLQPGQRVSLLIPHKE